MRWSRPARCSSRSSVSTTPSKEWDSCSGNIELVQSHLNRDLHVSTVLLTMYDGRTKLADQVSEEVRRHFGDKVLRAVVPRSVKVSEAPDTG